MMATAFLGYVLPYSQMSLWGKPVITLGLFPLAFIIAFSGPESGIAFIQAQVFVVLSCSYVKDALEFN